MKTIGSAILVVLGALIVLAIGGGFFTMLAYGVGLIISRFTGLDLLASTVISMAGMFLFGILVERTFNSFMSMPRSLADDLEFDDDEDDDDDEFDIDQDADLGEEGGNSLYKGVPFSGRPLKTLDFSHVKPDGRCPCGSGRKYKNCHGKVSKATSS
jgi:hypothetical protein